MRPGSATTLLVAGLLAGASGAAAVDMNPGASKPAVDVSRFELALNGQEDPLAVVRFKEQPAPSARGRPLAAPYS